MVGALVSTGRVHLVLTFESRAIENYLDMLFEILVHLGVNGGGAPHS